MSRWHQRLIALAETTATIETRTGTRETWHRKPTAPGRVLAWELIARRRMPLRTPWLACQAEVQHLRVLR